MILQLRRIHLIFRIKRGVLIQVRKEDRLRVRRFDVFTGTAVTVTAGADFVVKRAYKYQKLAEKTTADESRLKRTVNLVLLGTEDRGKVVGHNYCWAW